MTLDAEASGGVSVRDMRYPSDTQGWQCIWVDTSCQNAREGGSALWLKKDRERSAEETLDAVQPVESLRLAAEEGGLHVPQLRLSIPLGEGGQALHSNRHEIWVSDGLRTGRWQVDALRPLYRGNRRPPADAEMAHYPPEYVMFFYGIEHNVLLFCELTRPPIDAEFIEIYAQMRRRPDGKSLGPLHDVIWQSAAVALGLQPWSEAEYTAVFGQLSRSARHFQIGPSSRNYLEYLQQTIGSR